MSTTPIADAFPLAWPEGRARTRNYDRQQAQFDTSFARARDNIISQVKLLCGRYGPDPMIIISTNIALRRDGYPLANQRQPDDVGVAVYFIYKKKQMSFSCDRWRKIEHNMQAIAKTIEALRGVARWGTGDMLEAAFTGFIALPAPGSPAAQSWRTVLGFHPATRVSLDDARAAYRRLASEHHPDRPGGDPAKMSALNLAWSEAQQAVQ